MPNERFSASEDEKIIEIVAANSILWNTAHSEFKNQTKKDLIWMEIGKAVRRSDIQCKIRWKSIRDHFRKQKKQKNIGSKKRASYWGKLKFLEAVDNDIKPSSNIFSNTLITDEIPDTIMIDAEQNTRTSNSSASKNYTKATGNSKLQTSKIKKNKVLKKRQTNQLLNPKPLEKTTENKLDDETELFFKTMAATVTKFKPDLNIEAKIKIFKLVMELEVRNRKSSADVLSKVGYDSSSSSSS